MYIAVDMRIKMTQAFLNVCHGSTDDWSGTVLRSRSVKLLACLY